jgi:phosphoserine phosphatase RsbU/P
MRELRQLLDSFYQATRCAVAVWLQPERGGPLVLSAAAPAAPPPPAAEHLPAPGSPPVRTSEAEGVFIAAVPGPRRAWVVVGPCAEVGSAEGFARFLAPVVTQMLEATLEVEHAAKELAERYEEINLLYTTSEILGRTVALEEAASTILTEISETVGARRASILVHDRVTDTLQVVAALGVNALDAPPISPTDPCSVSARVFRGQHAMLVERDEMLCEAERLYRRGAMLSVPIMWTNPDGGQPLGVVNLSDRRSTEPFTAGDQKLVAAIATQIGTAIQNARLVRASLAQQRLVHEMELAHDLQMKLLPSTDIVAPEAQVAARILPAESVGGDFYHLFRLTGGRTGVMIGDVSSHGYRAALIMALAMGQSAIHAQSSTDPGTTLYALLTSLREELASTEMFMTLFYGVIDRQHKLLQYANTGHPHAFLIAPGGGIRRLPAMDPPLGMVDEPPGCQTLPWRPGEDLLLLFTDGVSDARNRADARLGEQAVLDLVREHRAEHPREIVDRVVAALRNHTGDVPLRDDLTLVVVRS